MCLKFLKANKIKRFPFIKYIDLSSFFYFLFESTLLQNTSLVFNFSRVHQNYITKQNDYSLFIYKAIGHLNIFHCV